MNIENISSFGATIGGGFFAGILIGYALKKVVKVVAIIVGLFFAGLAYLQYQQIVAINWNKVPQLSQNVVTSLTNATTQVPGVNSGHPADISISNFGIPLTGSMSVGFAIGFIRG
ncbi:MAG: FUN14 domain-containing protein [Thermoproteota archaeon]|nr:FUN14 domain-containing protein [Thermoproteota archaeon]